MTNARLIVVTPDREADLQEWSLYYGDLAGISIDRDTANRVTVTTCEDVVWRCTLPNANPEVLDAVTRHLRWVDHVRTRVQALEHKVEEVADEIRAQADEMNWEAAKQAYRQVRGELDGLISTVQLTTPVADAVLAPELTDIERSLEEANVRLYIERARSQLELARYLVENEEYDRAAEVLERTRALHRQAEGQSDAVERADAFAFGRQRELNEDLERLRWDLEEVAAEPIRQAHQAVVNAREADDTAAALEHWETAVRRYDRILGLDWWTEAQEATEEIDDARAEREQAVDRLVRTHTELASEQWDEGVRRRDEGDIDRAIECFEDAVTHLESAREFAGEFDHDDVDDIETQLAGIREELEELYTGLTRGANEDSEEDLAELAGEGSTDDGDEAETEATSDGSTTPVPAAGNDRTVRLQQATFTAEDRGADESLPPSMSDIATIESHHERTFDLDEICLPDDVSTGGEGDQGGDDVASGNGSHS